MVEHQLPKLDTPVRFWSPAFFIAAAGVSLQFAVDVHRLVLFREEYFMRTKTVLVLLFLCCFSAIFAQEKPPTLWCIEEPIRLIQTNLREIDLADFNVEQYVSDIEDMGANAVLINVGGIVANYPSKLPFHFVNPRIKTDVIADVIEQMHQKGIKVIGRFDFSKINETIGKENEEWLYVSVKGKHVNYNGQMHTCVNGAYRQKHTFAILEEAMNRYDMDGIFFNMSGYQVSDYSHNYHGICQADACRKRFKEWSNGLELPTEENKEDPVFLKYDEFRRYTTDELFERIKTFIKEKDPSICLCTYVDKGIDLRRHESGSQIHRSHEWEYHCAHNVKTVLGSYQNKQVSNAAVHFISFAFRHASVSPNLTEKRLIQNMIHGGHLDFYCIGRLDNQEDRASLKKVNGIFQFHKKHEKYFKNILSPAKVCIVTSNDWTKKAPEKGFIRFLSENHILYDLMAKDQLDAKDTPKVLESYDLLILPEAAELSNQSCKRIDEYVKNGGKILSTGLTSTKDEIGVPLNKIRLNCFGVEEGYSVYKKAMGTYFKLPNEPKAAFKTTNFSEIDLFYIYDDFIQCTAKEGAKPLLKFVYPAMFGPPEKCYYTKVSDVPGIICNEYGQGKSVYFPWRIGMLYNDRSHHGHAALLLGAINDLLGYKQTLHVEASPVVEVSMQESKAGKFSWIGLLNHSGQMNTAFHPPIPIFDIKIKYETADKVKSVKLLKAGQEIDFKQDANSIRFAVPRLNVFDIAVLEY